MLKVTILVQPIDRILENCGYKPINNDFHHTNLASYLLNLVLSLTINNKIINWTKKIIWNGNRRFKIKM